MHESPRDWWSCPGWAHMTRRQSLASMTGLFGMSGVANVTGLASATWMTGLAESLARAAEKSPEKRPKSLLILWLAGGPSQLETFDPHPGTKIGGDVKAIATTVPRLTIADTLPRTAEHMHRACLVRSVISKEGDHERATYNVKTGWRPEPTIVHPAIGAVLCHQQPSNLEIPRHISILAGQWPARGGYLGPAYDAFQMQDPDQPIPNLITYIDKPVFEKRVDSLLGTLEKEFRRGRLIDMDSQRTQHQAATSRALSMMNSSQLDAFDIKQEAADVRTRFGDTAFGRGCLAAIRLIERGVRCVEVELGGWDSHISNHELQSARCLDLDAALASTLNELAARDLLDDTVVFCGGEFGRTPQINPASGRDHWPHGFSVLLAGGNLRRGFVLGETSSAPDLQSEDPTRFTTSPVTIADLHATLLQALGVDYKQELQTPIGRPLRLSDGQVIGQLLT
ncbi:MAG: DUF1501 domain-containing protein [Pirellulaceae bacterium]|nr:DUF1501 domain-containing protein [Pirellulaceae bacterium]